MLAGVVDGAGTEASVTVTAGGGAAASFAAASFGTAGEASGRVGGAGAALGPAGTSRVGCVGSLAALSAAICCAANARKSGAARDVSPEGLAVVERLAVVADTGDGGGTDGFATVTAADDATSFGAVSEASGGAGAVL